MTSPKQSDVRLYLDQMLRVEVADALRQRGHDVVRATDLDMARADDEEILERACQEGRVLVTLDAHFGDWAVLPLSTHAGVIRLKVHPATVPNIMALLIAFLARTTDRTFANRLVIVDVRKERWISTDEN